MVTVEHTPSENIIPVVVDRYGKFHLARIMDIAEHFTEEVLLKLPHRQFVFTFPKALRVYFRNDRKLFAGFSRHIFAMIKEFYKEAAKMISEK